MKIHKNRFNELFNSAKELKIIQLTNTFVRGTHLVDVKDDPNLDCEYEKDIKITPNSFDTVLDFSILAENSEVEGPAIEIGTNIDMCSECEESMEDLPWIIISISVANVEHAMGARMH